MADLINVLPNFDLTPWRHLTFSLEKKGVFTAELISLDPIEIARKCPLPLKEVRRMAAAVTEALKVDQGHGKMLPPPRPQGQYDGEEPPRKRARIEKPVVPLKAVLYARTLDSRIDECLGGGFAAGSISEIVGESAVGKTQFVLTLLLAAQLPAPHGLGRRTLHLTTEDPLNTKRLHQILKSHPVFLDLPPQERPTTDDILTIDAHNLERQDHITTYQLPEAVRRYNVGLIVIDSVAANFRVEFQGASRKVLGERAVALVKLGKALRKVAHEYSVAIVCTNQVADRFDDEKTRLDKLRFMSSQSQGSSQPMQRQVSGTATASQKIADPSAPRGLPSTQVQNRPSMATQAPPFQGQHPPPSTQEARRDEIMSLDFQQRFFTGWGDNALYSPFEQLKTPALGLTWTNQIDARVVLKVSNTHDRSAAATGVGNESYLWSATKRRRHLKVVFAPWAASTVDDGVEYELEMQGPVSVEPVETKKRVEYEDFEADCDEEEEEQQESQEHAELLDPKYWDGIEDEEFP